MQIVTNPALVRNNYVREQVRFPRSRKRRIRNKWAKQPNNFRGRIEREYLSVQMGGTLYVHPVILEAMKAKTDPAVPSPVLTSPTWSLGSP